MAYFFDNLKNNFDFFLRSPLSRKNYFEKTEDLTDIFETEDEECFYNNLKEKYGSILENNTTQRIFLENIYFLNIFDKYLSKNKKENLSILDIGSKNWSYVRSEHTFFHSFAQKFSLYGIELDAYRLCSNFYTRYEIAKFYKKGLDNTNYVVGDFLNHEKQYDYIIWILPFITQYPLVKWGLPLRYFMPEEMLLHAYNLLTPNGELLIINQGEEEYLIQQNLYKNTHINPILFGEIEDKFNTFKNTRFCSKIIK